MSKQELVGEMRIERYQCVQCSNKMYSRDNVKLLEEIPKKMTYAQIADDADDGYDFGLWDFDLYIPSMRRGHYEKVKASCLLSSYDYGVIAYHSKESAIKAAKIIFNL